MPKKTKESTTNNGGERKVLKITPRQEDYSKWYLSVIAAASLSENAPVKGCMIIKPYGWAIWEIIQQTLDRMFKERGVENAYFPLFIPMSFLNREAEHVEGFSPELAIVTHAGGQKLEEPLAVRPTSETIIYDAFSRWIRSYRDLPLIINQWANVVRWELRPRPFLRTTEFLWQEGHTAHASNQEAEAFALMILNKVYQVFIEDFLAIPVYTGEKSESERFAGAKQTFTMEALMQDGKSLQMGTSHNLSDNFSRVFKVTYLDHEGQSQFVHNSSWGVSTRLIGGLIMSHSDDKGLVLPPKVAPIQVVIIPIAETNDDPAMKEAQRLLKELTLSHRCKLDERLNLRPGEKYYDWEKKGVPIRIELGPRDLAEKRCVIVRRDTGKKESVALVEVTQYVSTTLTDIQRCLFDSALARRQTTDKIVETWSEFEAAAESGGYIFAHWCGQTECEAAIKAKTKATTRCLSFNSPDEGGKHLCVHCGQPSPNNRRWIFARSY